MYAKTPVQKNENNTELLGYLIKKGADINAVDMYGKSVLDYVIENGYNNLASWMIKMGAKKS